MQVPVKNCRLSRNRFTNSKTTVITQSKVKLILITVVAE